MKSLTLQNQDCLLGYLKKLLIFLLLSILFLPAPYPPPAPSSRPSPSYSTHSFSDPLHHSSFSSNILFIPLTATSGMCPVASSAKMSALTDNTLSAGRLGGEGGERASAVLLHR